MTYSGRAIARARKTPAPHAVACRTPWRFACRKTAIAAADAKAHTMSSWAMVNSTPPTVSATTT
jgi:hypothetical protein